MGSNISSLAKKSDAQHENLKEMLTDMNKLLAENVKQCINPREFKNLLATVDCLAQSSISPDSFNEVKSLTDVLAENVVNADERDIKLYEELVQIRLKLERTEELCTSLSDLLNSISEKTTHTKNFQKQISILDNFRRDNESLKTEFNKQLNDLSLPAELKDSVQASSQSFSTNTSFNSSYLQEKKSFEVLIRSEDITFSKLIGEGGFCQVYSAQFHKRSLVAVKKLKADVEHVTKLYEDIMRREARCLKNLLHPNIVKFVGMIWEPHLHAVVLEYIAHGDLLSFIQNYSSSPFLKAKLLHDVAKGVHYLHWLPKQIIHNDLKAGNILVSDDVTAKITDFGMAGWVSYTTELFYSQPKSQAPQGATSSHKSPEKWLDINESCTKCDVYSYGILIWETYAEIAPFASCRNEDIKSAVIDGQRPDEKKLPADMPADMKDLMRLCWHKKSNERPDMSFAVKTIENLLTRDQAIKHIVDKSISEIKKLASEMSNENDISNSYCDDNENKKNQYSLSSQHQQQDTLPSQLQSQYFLIPNLIQPKLNPANENLLEALEDVTDGTLQKNPIKRLQQHDQPSQIRFLPRFDFIIDQMKGNFISILSAFNKKLLVSETGLSHLFLYYEFGTTYRHNSTILISNNDQLFDAKWTPFGNIVYTTLRSKRVVVMSESGEVIHLMQMMNPQHLSVSDDNVIYLADQDAGIFQSNDDGATWTSVFKPSDDWKCTQVIKVGTNSTNHGYDSFWTRGTRGDNSRLRIYIKRMNYYDDTVTWQDFFIPEIYVDDKLDPINLTGSDLLYDGDTHTSFLSDWDNRAVHVLSAHGIVTQLQELMFTPFTGPPFRIAMDKINRLLYVGLNNGGVRVYRVDVVSS